MTGVPAMAVSAELERMAYARFLGIRADVHGTELTTILPFSQDLIGNPILPALHGGVIGAFMEITAIAGILFAQLSQGESGGRLAKPIDVSIDYLRSGRPRDAFARAIITKLGRRVANVRVECWQDEPGRPIAALHGNFLVV